MATFLMSKLISSVLQRKNLSHIQEFFANLGKIMPAKKNTEQTIHLGLNFSSKLDWGSYIISVAKTASKKIGALICSMKFFSPEAALYLYKPSIRPCMEYCCHVWASAPSCYLELQDRLQKRYAGLLVLHLLPLLNP